MTRTIALAAVQMNANPAPTAERLVGAAALGSWLVMRWKRTKQCSR